MSYLDELYERGKKTVDGVKNKFQNPLNEFEKEIKNLKIDFEATQKSLAHLNALKIRAEKDIIKHQSKIKEYSVKAKEQILKGESGEISKDVAEQSALQVLTIKKAYEERIDVLKTNIPKYDEEISQLKEILPELKSKIVHYEGELDYIKNQNELNKSRKDVDTNFFSDDKGMFSRIEKLKQRITKQEIESDFYKENGDDLINDTLLQNEIKDELEEIKKNLKV